MSKKNGLCRITAFGCIFTAAFFGVAPNALAGSVTAPEAGYDISSGIPNPGSELSGEEMAALSASEAQAEELADVASGSLLALIGAVVVVYFVWRFLERN